MAAGAVSRFVADRSVSTPLDHVLLMWRLLQYILAEFVVLGEFLGEITMLFGFALNIWVLRPTRIGTHKLGLIKFELMVQMIGLIYLILFKRLSLTVLRVLWLRELGGASAGLLMELNPNFNKIEDEVVVLPTSTVAIYRP